MFDHEEFVAQCRDAVREAEPALAVREVIRRAVARPAPLPPALRTAPGAVEWFRSPELTVQCLVWPNGVITPPHEHRMWAVLGVLEGQEDNELWQRAPAGIERSGGSSVPSGDTLLLDADAIHAVSNPCRYTTISLHVYGGDLNAMPRSEWDFDGRNEHPWDLANVRRFVEAMQARGRALGRPLDFDEVRRACLENDRVEAVR